MEIRDYSVYASEPYSPNFNKLYKGVIVVVDAEDVEDSKYIHFAIRSKKVKDCIFKTKHEGLNKIMFNDANLSVSCDFDRDAKNKCSDVLYFDDNTYNELKTNIPKFMLRNGCVFGVVESENGFDMVF